MTYDDDKIGQIVREVVDDWAMPPVRLDQPSWRDRVLRDGNTGRGRGARLRPIWRAAGLAIVLIVSVAVLGVLLNTRAPVQPAAPGTSSAAQASPGPLATPAAATPQQPSPSVAASLPITGAKPSVTKSVVQLEDGAYAILDLADGSLDTFASAGRGSVAGIRPADGSIYCICVRYTDVQARRPSHATVTFERYDADGQQLSTSEIGQFDGAPDPRDAVSGEPEEPENVVVSVSYGTDRDLAYVGYSARQHPSWKSGILIVELDSGNVVDRIELPDATDGDGNTRRMTDAPRVAGSAGAELLVGRPFYEWSPADASQPSFEPGLQAFRAAVDHVSEIDMTYSCGTVLERAGALDSGGLWLQCINQISQVVIQQLDANGSRIDYSAIDTFLGDGSLTALSPDGRYLYVWNPVDLKLTRVAVATGESTTVDGAPESNTDVLTQIGQWLIPSARAKILLSSGVAISRDGSHLYALGVADPAAHEASGSTGIYAFSLGQTMTVVRWQPTADFVSVAVSGDGAWVYAAGMPGVNAAGDPSGQPASVTVFNAESGEVAQFAGELGRGLVLFAQPVLP